MTWQDGKLIGFRPGGPTGRLRVPFLALSPSEFAGYYLFIAQNVSLWFEIDKKGNVTGLKIKGSGQEKLLKKVI